MASKDESESSDSSSSSSDGSSISSISDGNRISSISSISDGSSSSSISDGSSSSSISDGSCSSSSSSSSGGGGGSDSSSSGSQSDESDDYNVITLCSWNINGENAKGMAKIRKTVVSKTLKVETTTGSEKTTLSNCDLICLQEVGKSVKKHVPTAANYGVKMSTGDRPYNMVLHNKKKFTPVNHKCLKKAFRLMKKKRKIYDFIASEASRIKTAIKKTSSSSSKKSSSSSSSSRKRRKRKRRILRKKLKLRKTLECKFPKYIVNEVLQECKEAKTPDGFRKLISRYKVPHQKKNTIKEKTKSPKYLLNLRMGIAVLEFSDEPLIVISFHSYYICSGRGAPHTYLLFDFLEKLKITGICYPVIIAGDFNCDIRKEPLLKKKFLGSYHVSKYDLTSLRTEPDKRGVKLNPECIDFIVVSKKSKFRKPVITAHDMEVSHENMDDLKAIEKLKLKFKGATRVQKIRAITNHSPLSTTLQRKQ